MINLKQVYVPRVGQTVNPVSIEDTCNQKKQEKDIKLKADQAPKVEINPPKAQRYQTTALGEKNYG
jgi:hypothetical protein